MGRALLDIAKIMLASAMISGLIHQYGQSHALIIPSNWAVLAIVASPILLVVIALIWQTITIQTSGSPTSDTGKE
ncbi:MAG: hypothetical protein AAGG02_01800 [Cyanobacteria bacterium P01_H01_bin.15]